MSKIEQPPARTESSTFTGLWPVEHRYAIVVKKVARREIVVICPSDLKKPRFIEPDSFPRIAWEFAEVRSPTQLLTFAHKFGLLGFARLFPLAPKYDGDPVEWSLGHARRVAVAFEIVSLIKRGASQVQKELPGVLRSIGFDLTGNETNVEQFQKRLFKPNSLFDAGWPGDPLHVAWRVLSHLINDQIRGLKVEVSEEKFRPVFAVDALLQVVYWQLAGELEGLSLRLCIVCKIFFRAKRIDARHCSDKCRMRDSRDNKKIGKKLRRKR